MVRGPLVPWKTLTLPWPAVRVQASYAAGPWHIAVRGQGGGPRAVRGMIRLQRHLTGALWVEAVAGWPFVPQWRDQPVRALGLGLIVR